MDKTYVGSRMGRSLPYTLTCVLLGLLGWLGRTSASSCTTVTLPLCQQVLPDKALVSFPNALGHQTEGQVQTALASFSLFLDDPTCGPYLQLFLCHLMAAPCTSVTSSKTKKPCRSSCKAAYKQCHPMMRKKGLTWPSDFRCSKFPTSNCLHKQTRQIYQNDKKEGRDKKEGKHAQLSKASAKISVSKAPSGKSLKDLKLDIVTADRRVEGRKHGSVKPRRQDIVDMGQANFFSGWVDVQGQGVPNDYCRVIDKTASTRYLSCRLAGSSHDMHNYVSVKGFDVGHRGTWFMKDMDDDGRDDYCRCVGRGSSSKMSCMKAGQFGFYGSQRQGGNQYTFIIKDKSPCISDSPVTGHS